MTYGIHATPFIPKQVIIGNYSPVIYELGISIHGKPATEPLSHPLEYTRLINQEGNIVTTIDGVRCMIHGIFTGCLREKNIDFNKFLQNFFSVTNFYSDSGYTTILLPNNTNRSIINQSHYNLDALQGTANWLKLGIEEPLKYRKILEFRQLHTTLNLNDQIGEC